jgi:hypothetical protein
MKYSISLLLGITLLLSSCKNDETTAKKTDPRFVVPFTQQTAVAANTTAVPTVDTGNHNLFHESNSVQPATVLGGINPAHGQPNHRCDIAVGSPLNSASQSATTAQNTTGQMQQTVAASSSTSITASGINPPHGEKNHRCDIAVGAPLNSKAAVATPPAANYVLNQPATSSKTTTASGMNPPHGEKNHRCDIGVGAPLNSKVVESATATSGKVSQEINVQSALPTLLSTTAADTETPAGMNPAHGKEGHRCDIAVGAPLPKS